MKGYGTLKIGVLVMIAAVAGLPVAWAQTPAASPVLTIRNQAFQPRTLTIPAGQRVRITVKNDDALPAEFESSDLNQEKVIPGHTALPVYVGPLKVGTYKFFNDFHPASTGMLVVAQPKR